MKKIILSTILLLINLCFGQLDANIQLVPSVSTGERYLTGEDGVIRMYVNVWGHVKAPGRILVNDGIDMATLLSLIGGPMDGADLNKITVYHEYPDKNGSIFNTIDLNEFIKTGDRSNFIKIYPNDTFIFNQTPWSYFLQEINTINLLVSLLNIYLNIINL